MTAAADTAAAETAAVAAAAAAKPRAACQAWISMTVCMACTCAAAAADTTAAAEATATAAVTTAAVAAAAVALKSHRLRDFSVKWHHRSNTSRHDRGQPKLPVQNGIVVSRPPLMLHECRAGAANERERCHLVKICPRFPEFMRGSKMSTLSAVNMPSARPDTY